MSRQEQLLKAKRIRNRYIKEVHRVRRNRYLALFLLIVVIFGVQLAINLSTTHRIKGQIVATKAALVKQKKVNKKLTNQRDNLKDPDYVAKLIRYRFYYSKKGEEIYNVPENSKN
ncbi:hypothetical protein FC23_GL001333 [Lactobacillus psittaci DSM 15354]|uniref:Septum formation initiator n=2 Tax=Lactobacillus psittaci TaxID=116089 RepID=A0A0R1S003_9LACO|nr:hypothetical protein FC23_GL001333 [Lactobacillus psittaci DSM 15354]